MAGKPLGKASPKTSRKPYRVGRSPTGLGLFATEPIAKGAFIVEYKCRRITNAQAKRLEARGSRYMYEINNRWTVNRSRRPNLDQHCKQSFRMDTAIVHGERAASARAMQ